MTNSGSSSHDSSRDSRHGPKHDVQRAHGLHEEWTLDRGFYPASEPIEDRLMFLLRYAILAPSAHNSQPWLFRVTGEEGGRVDVFADRRRRCSIVDPHDRELTISCGCALMALRLAMRRHGLADLVSIRPNAADPDLLASVWASGVHATTDDDTFLFKAIMHRRTHRGAYETKALPEHLVTRLVRDAGRESAAIMPVNEMRLKHQVANLVAEGDRAQMRDAAFRTELAKWMRSNHTEKVKDGIPAYAEGHSGGLWEIAPGLEPLIVRTFERGIGRAARDQELAEGSPLLMIIYTENDTPIDWIHAGQALMRLSLRVQAAGVYVSYLNQPIEVPVLRRLLTDTLGIPGAPQLLLRLGYADAIEPTPRRPLSEVLKRDDPFTSGAQRKSH
jgi:nitroreductase